MADIDFGQLSEALNDKSDRDLRNVDTTAKADAVIDFQLPAADNGYTWYRKYASGWVEQGGSYRISPANRDVSATITFPVVLSSINYVATCCPTSFQYSNNNTGYIFTQQKTISSCIFHVYTNNSGSVCDGFDWQVSGMAAN